MSQKVSARTAASTPLTGAETLLVIQGGNDRRATVGDIMLNADVRQTTVASGVTTNTSSSPVAIPTGPKTFMGLVAGTGSVTQTQAIYGNYTNANTNGVLLGTLTLSGTTQDQAALPVVTANFSYYYVVTTSTTGTSATGAVYAMY